MPYARTDPTASGSVAIGDGTAVAWEESGNPEGVPALWLHGGPGGSLGSGWYRTHFDPDRYRLIGIDQRGSGKSRPLVTDARDRLHEHTTARLIADIEVVRAHLGVTDWVVAGISWGTTLALAYAEAHPDRVRALALMAVTTTSRQEVDWLTEGVGRVFPEEWARFERDSHRRPGERVVDAYARRLAGDDADDRAAAASAWDRWENVHVSLDDPGLRDHGHIGPERREGFATLVTHYWSNDGFLPGDRAVLVRLRRIRHVPTALVHGRRDISGPVVTAWRVHQALPGSTLTVIEDEGHAGPAGSAALSEALDRFC
jgi:proline iminopeptidase